MATAEKKTETPEPEAPEPEAPETVKVRASVHLVGFAVGQIKTVDPSDLYIAECIEGGALVIVG